MELGLKGKRALVCGAGKGLGLACAHALAAEGVEVTLAARTPSDLSNAVRDIRERHGMVAHAVTADVTTVEGRSKILLALPDPDILVTNSGGPPPGRFRDWTTADWHAALNNNMISAIELIRQTIDPMIERRFGRVINITSGAVKAPILELGLSNGARSGLTGFVAGVAREVAAFNVTVNNLLPGFFATDRLLRTVKFMAEQSGQPLESFEAQKIAGVPAKRFGHPEEFGAFCAFVCSVHAGYLTGQNILLDGGHYPGAL